MGGTQTRALLPLSSQCLGCSCPGASHSECASGEKGQDHILCFHQLLLLTGSRAPHVGILYLNQEKQSC